jgi:hypothetical protein
VGDFFGADDTVDFFALVDVIFGLDECQSASNGQAAPIA